MTIQKILSDFGNQTVEMIQANLAATGTNASGETSESLRSDMPSENKVIVSGRPFFNTVETGRRPGKMPPVSKIMGWLETGKVPIATTIENASWAIAKNIAKFGSKLFQEGGRTDIITPAVSDARIDELTEQIADATLGITVNVIENATKR